MAHSPLILSAPAPIAEIERRLQWRVLSVMSFVGILVGLAVVAAMSQFVPPRIVTGLPDDADLRAAALLTHGRTLLDAGPLRLHSEMLGDGATDGVFAPLERLRATRALALVERAQSRHGWDARVWAAAGALELVHGDSRAAEHDYRAALDRAPHYGEARLGLGATLALRAALEPGPFRPRALQLAAIAQFAAVPRRDPVFELALWNRARLLRQVGRGDEARRTADDYLLRDPRSRWAEQLLRD